MPHIRRRSKRPSIAQVTSVPEAEELLVQDEDKIHVPRATKDPWWISALEVPHEGLAIFNLPPRVRHSNLLLIYTFLLCNRIVESSRSFYMRSEYIRVNNQLLTLAHFQFRISIRFSGNGAALKPVPTDRDDSWNRQNFPYCESDENHCTIATIKVFHKDLYLNPYKELYAYCTQSCTA